MLSIQEFCDKYHACKEGRDWAIKNCKDMKEVWNKAKPEYVVWIATQPGVLTEKEQRLFACWCVRQAWHLLPDERRKHVIEVAEKYAKGLATDEEFDEVWDDWKSEWYEKGAATFNAWDAAWEAAWTACVAGTSESDKQAEYLRANYKPNFERNITC